MKNIIDFEKFILLEKSFHNIGYDDVFTSDYKKNIKKDDVYDNGREVFMSMNDIEDSDDIDEEGFEDYMKNELENNFEVFQYTIADLIDENDEITIWRAMTVNDEWLSKLEKGNIRIGEFWSWSESGAEAHWSEGHDNTVVLKAKIKEYYVDWKETFELNIHPNYYEEKEIRLFKNTPLRLEEVIFNDEEIDETIYKNKVYKG
jgi:hypothetical protein